MNLPLNLVNVPSVGGLGMTVSIVYNSADVGRQAGIWNLDAPTGILGLGWSMDMPKIIVNNKGTGTRIDDDFYLMEGGTSNKLILTSYSTSLKTYSTKSYHFWVINYYPDTEKWEIIKEDGKTYIYGDVNSGRSTVQYIVKWGNWIGSSSNVNGQEQQAHTWHLSQVVSTGGHSVDFTYENVNQKVGSSSGQEHTEASYISQIEDPLGRKVYFEYKEKLSNEYMEPHTENGTNKVDAYQESYERKYLDKISVQESDGTEQYSIRFNYRTDLLGTGNLTKRLLTSITRFSGHGSSFPETKFNYKNDGPNKGALNRLTTPLGAQVDYNYNDEGVIINHSKRDLQITAPSGFEEPRVLVTDEYVIVTWRKQGAGGAHTDGQMEIKVYAYRWEGRWHETFLQTVYGITAEDWIQKFDLLIERDFFALLKPNHNGNNYSLFIWKKDELRANNWHGYVRTIDVGAGKPKLLTGENFVAVGERHDGDVHTFIPHGDSWYQDRHVILSEPFKENYYYTANNNFIIRHSTAGTDNVDLLFLDETSTWRERNFPRNHGMNANASKESFWHSGSTFAVVMAQGGNEFLYHWDENFNNVEITDTGIGYADNGPVVIIDNYQAGFVSDDEMKTFRFDGGTWNSRRETGITTPISFSPHGFFYSKDKYTYLKEFNPNSGSWGHKSTLNREVQTGSQIAWVLDGLYPGNNTFLFKRMVYYRNTAGIWFDIGTSSRYRINNTRSAWTKPSGAINRPGFHIGDIRNRSSSNSNHKDLHFYKNGKQNIYADLSGYTNLIEDVNDSRLISNSVIAAWYPVDGQDNTTKFRDVKSLFLYKVLDYDVVDKVNSYPVQSVSITGIESPIHTYFKYELSKAITSSNSNLPLFNRVTVIPGSEDGVSRPLGRTEQYFFNGLTSGESAQAFPNGNSGNAHLYYQALKGVPYMTKTYDASGGLLSSNSTSYKLTEKGINVGPKSVIKAHFARPVQISTENDGIKSTTSITYNTDTYQKSSETSSIVSGGTSANETQVFFKYWWEIYNTNRSKNILTPLVQTKAIKEGVTVSSSATKFAGGTANPIPDQTWVWKRSGSPDFSAWSFSTMPGSNWRLASNVSYVDSYNRVLETTDNQGVYSATGLDELGRQVYSVYNARRNQVLYEDFEFNGNSSLDPKTGLKCRSGSYSVVLPSSGTYWLTYWERTGTGNWELEQQTISSNTTISGAGKYVDQVRLIPVGARMTSSSYDEFGYKLAEINANHQITYYEYDRLNRLKLVRDQDKNIVARYQTFFHNDNRRIGVYGDFDFGEVLLDENKTRILTIVNEGFENLSITSLSLPVGFSGSWSGTLTPGQRQEVIISFIPTEDKTYSGLLSINANETSGLTELAISGRGKAVREISLRGASGGFESMVIDFGELNTGTSATRTLRIKNSGNDDLRLFTIAYPDGFDGPHRSLAIVRDDIITIDEDGDLIDEEGNPILDEPQPLSEENPTPSIGIPIAPGSYLDVSVTFGPESPISYDALLEVNSNYTDGVNTIQLLGSGKVTRTISVSEPLSFGAKNTGTTTSMTVQILNTGNSPLTISSFTVLSGFSASWADILEDSGPQIEGDSDELLEDELIPLELDGPRTILPGQFMPLIVSFSPTAPVSYNGNLIFNGDFSDGNNTLPLTGSGIATRVIALSGNLSFGERSLNTNSVKNLVITNNGNSNLTINGISLPAGFTGNWSGTIAPGSSRSVVVTFRPTEVRSYSGSLTVSSNSTSGGNTRSVSGSGQPTRLIALSGNLNFGSVPTGTTSKRNLIISNTGNSPLIIYSIQYPNRFSGWDAGLLPIDNGPQPIEDSPMDDGIENGSGSIIIPAGGQTTIEVSFSPTSAQNYGGTLTVTSNKTGGIHIINVSGQGAASRIVNITGSLSFGSRSVGSTTNRSITVSNSGNQALTISSITLPGGFTASFDGPQLPGPVDDDEPLDGLPIDDFGDVPGNSTSAVIQPGQSKALMVTFQPTASVNYNGSLILNGNHTSGNNTLPVSGSGIATRIIRLTGSLSFGSVTPNSNSSRTLRIYNDGNSTLSVTSITYPNGFSGNWSGSIAPGSYRNVTVTFRPTAAGTSYSGSLTVNSNRTSGTNTRAVSGSGAGSRIISLSGNLAFGQVQVNTNAYRTLTIRNTGNTTLTVFSISYPPGFSGNWNGTIPPGGSRNVSVRFRPTLSGGIYGGSIVVNSNRTSGTNTRSVSGLGFGGGGPLPIDPIEPIIDDFH
ncbi:MAG: choice-of-anchor D domain-containing protein [Bacteroidota bacterium]